MEEHDEGGGNRDAHRVDPSIARAVALYEQVCVVDVLTSLSNLEVDFANRARKGLLKLCYTQSVTSCADEERDSQ